MESEVSVSLSSDNKRLVSSGEDRSVRIWDLATGKQTQVLEGHTGYVCSVDLP